MFAPVALQSSQYSLPDRSSIRRTVEPLQTNSRQVRVHAVKLDGEGWIGVSPHGDRCRGHGHPTPELAKLCVLHGLPMPDLEPNVVLLPMPAAQRPDEHRAAGTSG